MQRAEADVFVAGGTESSITPITFAAFGRMGALASQACRPFSVDRDGLVAGEGAAAVVLETEEHARARGATLYAEVLGGKLTADAFHVTAPDPESDGAVRAIAGALAQAKVAPEEIDMVYAHGTATPLNDAAVALRRAFGAWADKLYVTSIKSMIGHGFGAAGAQSLVAAVHTLRTGLVPPTINYTPDPAIDLHIVGNVAERVDAHHPSRTLRQWSTQTAPSTGCGLDQPAAAGQFACWRRNGRRDGHAHRGNHSVTGRLFRRAGGVKGRRLYADLRSP